MPSTQFKKMRDRCHILYSRKCKTKLAINESEKGYIEYNASGVNIVLNQSTLA